MRVIRNDYGKELAGYDFDYIGRCDDIDAILINAKVKLYEKGILIFDELEGELTFIHWDSISKMRISKDKPEKVEIYYDDFCIKLEKSKKQTDVNKFRDIVYEYCENIQIDYFKYKSNVIDISMELFQRKIEEQDRRIDKVIGKSEDDIECMNKWKEYIEKNVNFPFVAEVVEHQESSLIEQGDRIIVIRIDDVDDERGITVEASINGIKCIIPLYDLQSEDENGLEIIDDYASWFARL